MKIYVCKHCANIFETVVDGKVTPKCCGAKMEVLEANTTDAAQEKHVPVVNVSGNEVNVVVGSVEHPMTDEHYIPFIMLKTTNGVYRKDLNSTDKPVAKFVLATDEKPLEVYEYCNLHGLWKYSL